MNKLKTLKIMVPVFFKIIQFRIKVFFHKNKLLKTAFFIFFFAFFSLFFSYFFFLSPPSGFKPGTVLQIEPGMSLRSISLRLKEENIIRSRLAFEVFVILLGGDKRIKYSNYVFEENSSVYQVAKEIVNNNRYLAPVVVTIPEGFNKEEIANAFTYKLIKFNKTNFLLKAKEGYLFPDTYYFLTEDDEEDVIESMSKNFTKKITPIQKEIISSGRSEASIINMASIIEKEAKGDVDRGIISGILWERLDKGMRLQVDAAPITYKEKGLPGIPISNPGLEAIHAAIYPKSSPYLYYLHGKDGNTYYAKTFEEHKSNIAKYLK